MREINYGPVANPDGTPTELTKQMLAGTGRDPVAFAAGAVAHPHPVDGSHQGLARDCEACAAEEAEGPDAEASA